jgi:hypothetical protein
METKIKNQQAFSVKLYNLGICISGSNSSGCVWDMEGNDISHLPEIQRLIAEHNAETVEEPSPFEIL